MSLERIDDSEDTPWWGEHDHRYREVLSAIGTGKKILDIACGTGFGTFKLYAQGANHVMGGDISDDAVQYCLKKYGSHVGDKLKFIRMDATSLPFENETFDVVASFETLEHVADCKAVLNEFKRVLKREGVLFLSTPNQEVSSPGGIVVNPFHVKEYNYDELRDLLSVTFSSSAIGGQRYIRYAGSQSRWAPMVEKFFYLRGIRRLSLPLKDRIMRWLGMPRFYPLSTDYEIVWEAPLILKCPTFYVICRK